MECPECGAVWEVRAKSRFETICDRIGKSCGLSADKVREILKLHWAGKRHSVIARKYNILKAQVGDIVLKYAKVSGGWE